MGFFDKILRSYYNYTNFTLTCVNQKLKLVKNWEKGGKGTIWARSGLGSCWREHQSSSSKHCFIVTWLLDNGSSSKNNSVAYSVWLLCISITKLCVNQDNFPLPLFLRENELCKACKTYTWMLLLFYLRCFCHFFFTFRT